MRKYRKGERIKTLAAFARLISHKNFIYHRDRITHWAWAQNWTFRAVQQMILNGYLYEAKLIDEEDK